VSDVLMRPVVETVDEMSMVENPDRENSQNYIRLPLFSVKITTIQQQSTVYLFLTRLLIALHTRMASRDFT